MGSVDSGNGWVQVIPSTGKTRFYDREQKKSALHLAAWASEHRLVLGQMKV